MISTASSKLRGSMGCLLALAALVASPLACSSDDATSLAPEDDAGGATPDAAPSDGSDASDELDASDDAGTSSDAAGDAAAPTSIDEKEPNDTAETVQAIPAPPVAVKGSVDPVGDIDAFRATLQAGDFVVWRIEPAATTWAPYMGVIEKNDAVPHYVGHVQGAAFEIEQFVTKSSEWQLIVSDWNNIKAGGTKVGGPAFGYVVTAEKVARTPTPITVGASVTQSLATPYAAALFALTLTSETALEIEVRAKRKGSPSDMDSRLTLFDRNAAAWVATNDDIALEQTDSMLGSDALPAGSYVIVVENVDPASQDRSFELSVAVRD